MLSASLNKTFPSFYCFRKTVCWFHVWSLIFLPQVLHFKLGFFLCVFSDAFDREFQLAFEKLTPAEQRRLQPNDKPKSDRVICCRRSFGDLEIWASCSFWARFARKGRELRSVVKTSDIAEWTFLFLFLRDTCLTWSSVLLNIPQMRRRNLTGIIFNSFFLFLNVCRVRCVAFLLGLPLPSPPPPIFHLNCYISKQCKKNTRSGPLNDFVLYK